MLEMVNPFKYGGLVTGKDFEMYSPSSLRPIMALACQQEKP